MTVIICVAFGGVAEVVSKYLYVWKKPLNKIGSQEQKSKLANRVIDDDTDEELEEKYANIEVNFDESESEEEEYIRKPVDDVSDHNLENQTINVTEEEIAGEQSVEYNDGFDNSTNEIQTDYFDESDFYDDSVLLGETVYAGDVPVSRGKSFIHDDYVVPNETKDIGK